MASAAPQRFGWETWALRAAGGVAALFLLLLVASALRAIIAHRNDPPVRHVAVERVAIPAVPIRSPVRAIAAPTPAPGTTGTVALPPEPVAATVTPGAPTVTPALPFRYGGASALDRGRALECLADAVYFEAASEPDDGQRAVAQVVLNRVRHPAFPASVCGVVFQGSEAHGCQFSFACDGSMARARSRSAWTRALRIAADALAGQVFAGVGLATHYHTYAVTPAWNRALVMTDAIGMHFFHRWKGYWGTAAAFHQSYAGHEPEPGPHAHLPDPVVAPDLTLALDAPTGVTATPPPAPVTPATQVQPAHLGSGTMLADPEVARLPDVAKLPEGSQVLDRWKDSGKPLR